MKMKKKLNRNLFVLTLLLTICVGIQSVLPGNILRAADREQVIPSYAITYNEDSSVAKVDFDVSVIDHDKYELIKLATVDEQTVLLNTESGIQNLSYEITSNGNYGFVVYFKEKIQEVQNDTIEGNSSNGEEPIVVNDDTSVVNEKNVEDVIDKEVLSNNTKIQTAVFEVVIDGIKETVVVNELNSNEEKESVQQNNIGLQNVKAATTSGAKIDLNGQFYSGFGAYSMSGINGVWENLYSYVPFAKVDGNIAQLSDSVKAFEMPYYSNVEKKGNLNQGATFTSKYQIDFKRDWVLDGSLFQPLCAEGFTFSFHNQQGYTVNSTGGYLGVYGDAIKNGLVFEIDGYSNMWSPTMGDEDTLGKAGAHLRIHHANGTGEPDKLSDPVLIAGGTKDSPTSDYLGTEQPFSISYDASTRTITWKYGGNGSAIKELSYTFTSENDILDKMGTMTPYYSMTSVMVYSPELGDTQNTGSVVLKMNEFKYTDMVPDVKETLYYRIEEKSNDKTKLNNNLDHQNRENVRSGDTVLISHKLNNTNSTLIDIEDQIKVSTKLASGTDLTPIAGSAKYYVSDNIKTDDNGKTALNDSIFTEEGVNIIYPKESGAVWVEYRVKIPDYLDQKSIDKLISEQVLGKNGMSQTIETQEMQVVSRGDLLSNGKVVDNVFYSPMSSSGGTLGNLAKDYIYNNWTFQSQGATNTLDLSFAASLLPGMWGNPTFSVENFMTYCSITTKHYKGNTTDLHNPTEIETNNLGMYYTVVSTDEYRFSYSDNTPAPNGRRNSLRRLYICDNHVTSDDESVIGISKNFTIDEVALSKMTDEGLKKKLLEYIQVYTETVEFEAETKLITGNLAGKLENIEASDINVKGIANTSDAGDSGSKLYNATVTISVDGKTIDLPINVTVVNGNVIDYIVIPTEIELDNNSGISGDYIGKKAQVKLITEQQTTSKNFLIRADTGFELASVKNDHIFFVDLYDSEKNKLTNNEGIAEIGTLNKNMTSLDVWLNAKKTIKQIDNNYKGTMKFYISMN